MVSRTHRRQYQPSTPCAVALALDAPTPKTRTALARTQIPCIRTRSTLWQASLRSRAGSLGSPPAKAGASTPSHKSTLVQAQRCRRCLLEHGMDRRHTLSTTSLTPSRTWTVRCSRCCVSQNNGLESTSTFRICVLGLPHLLFSSWFHAYHLFHHLNGLFLTIFFACTC